MNKVRECVPGGVTEGIVSSPDSDVESLTPSNSECDCFWRRGLLKK